MSLNQNINSIIIEVSFEVLIYSCRNTLDDINSILNFHLMSSYNHFHYVNFFLIYDNMNNEIKQWQAVPLHLLNIVLVYNVFYANFHNTILLLDSIIVSLIGICNANMHFIYFSKNQVYFYRVLYNCGLLLPLLLKISSLCISHSLLFEIISCELLVVNVSHIDHVDST